MTTDSNTIINKATTSKLLMVFIGNSSVTTGAGLTGLAWNTASIEGNFYREGAGTGGTAISLQTATIGTWASGGFVEIDASKLPGWYELGIPNAAIATGADSVKVMLFGAANMRQTNIEILLTDVDFMDAVRGGMTALPNAAADAGGGLVISDSGGADIDELIDAIIADAAGANIAIDIIALKAETVAILADTGTTLDGKINNLETAVIANAAGADVATDIIALKAETVSILSDSNAILVDTGTTLDAAIIGNAAGADIAADIIALKAETVNILVDTAQMNLGIVVGVVENADLTTTTCRTDLAEGTDDHYIGRLITFTSNVLNGQSSDITDYTGSTGVVTFTAMTESATSGDTFKIT